ncbi:T9SS type B sorting domain-containing protein [bacterium]|nr:T9SS type B sorting domain-containing protein [bacterium]
MNKRKASMWGFSLERANSELSTVQTQPTKEKHFLLPRGPKPGGVWRALTAAVILFTGVVEAQVCDPTGNVVVFSNYEGGVLNIEVNQNIPNLKIGVCTYEAVAVNITGAFAANVVELIYAGYGSTAPSPCAGPIISGVQVNGFVPPQVTVYDAAGGNTALTPRLGEVFAPIGIPLVNCMVGTEGCVNLATGGGNSSNQIVDYFLTEFGPGSVLFSHWTDYSCFPSTPFLVSAGGNCCLQGMTTPLNPLYAPNGQVADFLGPDTDLCNGPVTLDLSNYPVINQPTFYGYYWSNGSNSSSITVSTPGTYYVCIGDYCHDAAQCLLSDTIVIASCCNFTVSAASPVALDCVSGLATLNVSTTAVNPTIVWTGPSVVNGANTPNATVNAPGIYIVTVTDPNCGQTDTVVVTGGATGAPSLALSVSSKISCDDPLVTLTAQSDPGASFLWTGPNVVTAQNSASVLVGLPGWYTAVVTDASGSCSTEDSILVRGDTISPAIVAYSLPVINCANPVGNIRISTNHPDARFQWTGPGLVSGVGTAAPSVDEAGEYVVVVRNPTNNCTRTYSFEVTEDGGDALIFIPDAFTPNRDGNNDQIWVEGACEFTFFHWQIYDRWGTLVFETQKPAKGWKGTNLSDVELPNGFYSYVLQYSLDTRPPKSRYGQILLLGGEKPAKRRR